jgi:NAD(P)-dependent dehydrogenase (short-subunit alcohol dehydrogenase family)
MGNKVWFITGASRGFGRVWAEAALQRGDKVAATARDPQTLDELAQLYGDAILPIELDVTDRAADFAAVTDAKKRFGRLDVVINNAGYGLFGAIEEVSEAQARAQMETNFFGALWVTQAALPILREQGSGHIIQISSLGGVRALPGTGLYSASKWALEAFSESLAQEVAPFGVHITIVEPNGFATDWSGSSAVRAETLPAYEAPHAALAARHSSGSAGIATATAEAMFKIVDAAEPPLRIFFGKMGLPAARALYTQRLQTWEEWWDVSQAAQGN